MTDEINLITQTEERMYDLHQKIVSAITPEEKKALRIRLKTLEKKYNATMEQDINGKEYPIRKVPPKISKEELLKLIDSVETPDPESGLNSYVTLISRSGVEDESGVSPGKNRFEYIDKGW